MATKRKTSVSKAKKIVKKKKSDPLDRWALEPGFKMNLKRCDQAVSVNVTSGGSTGATLLNTIAQGVGDNMRIGQRCRYFNWTVRGAVQWEPAASSVSQSDYIRCIFFYDRQSNGGLAQWNQVIGNISTGTSTSFDPPNWYTRGRFKIIRDFNIATPPQASVVAAGLITSITGSSSIPAPQMSEMKINFFKALKGKLDSNWNGTGSTATNMNGGALCFVCQNANGTGQFVTTFTSTIEYMDV